MAKAKRETGLVTISVRMKGFLGGSEVKNLPEMQETQGWIPGSGRSPGEADGKPLQYSYLGNPIDRGAWQATVHEVARVGHVLGTKPQPTTR